MKAVLTLAAVFVMLTLVSSVCESACMEPAQTPEIPNGVKASREQMLDAQRALKAYDNAVKNYADCLRDEGDTSSRGSLAVDRVLRLADRFNSELRAFKERNGAG